MNKTIFWGLILLLLPLSLAAQPTRNGSTRGEVWVRADKKQSQSKENQQLLRLLGKEKREAEKVSRWLKSRVKGPNASLSALEQVVLDKTERRLDSLTKAIADLKTARNRNDHGELAGAAKQQMHQSLEVGKNQAASTHRLNEWRRLSPDSLKAAVSDSLQHGVLTAAGQSGTAEAMQAKEVQEVKELIDQVKTLEADSVGAAKIAETLVQKTEYGKALDQLNGPGEVLNQAREQIKTIDQEAKALEEQVKALQDRERLQQYAREKAAKLAGAELASFAPQIQQAQQQFAKYKKKMEWLKEGSGKKANSLKEEPIGKRLVYGGNFQLPAINPFTIVAAPYLGYRLNKKFTSGISFSYRAVVGKNDPRTKAFGGEMGYRAFTDYRLVRNWFAHVELERMGKAVQNQGQDGYHTDWQSNAHIGAGRQINVVKGWKVNVLFLVNLLHEDLKYFGADAFQFRFGFGK